MDKIATKQNQVSSLEIENGNEVNSRSIARTRWKKPSILLNVVNRMKMTNKLPPKNAARERSKKLEDILTGTFRGKITLSNSVNGFIGIALSVLFSIIMTLWPQHNVIGNAKYWYEYMLVIATCYAPIAAANIVFTSFYCMGLELKSVFKPLLFVFMSGASISIVISSLLYVIWVFAIDFKYPMPFQGYLVGFLTWHGMTISLWFQIPKKWRYSPRVRRRMKFAILFLLVISATEVAYKVIRKVFLVIPTSYQWTLFIVLIVIRELHAKVLSILGRKVAEFDDWSIELIGVHFAACRHTLFLAVAISTVATYTTSFVILGIDFITNILLSVMIIYLHKNPSAKSNRWKTNAVMNLVINESVEFIMPIAYILCFLMAYYGPNASILGNVKNDYWQYSAVSNIDDTMKWISIMFAIDFISTIISALLLRIFCKLNILKVYILLQKEMWNVLSVHQCYLVEEVSYSYCLLILLYFCSYFIV